MKKIKNLRSFTTAIVTFVLFAVCFIVFTENSKETAF